MAKPRTAASGAAGEGAVGAGLPLPQTASAQETGTDKGSSTSWTAGRAMDAAPDATPRGTRPPKTAAATTATNARRHGMRIDATLGAVLKNELKRVVRAGFEIVADPG